MDGITGRKVQRIGLSATTGNPEEVLAWLSDGRGNAELVAVPAPPQEKQFSFLIEPEERKRIDALAGIVAGKKSLVFVNSRSVAEHLAQALEGRVRNLHIHHSSLSPSTRKSAEDAFLSDDGACIICTSTLELGIDIGDLDVVVQVGPPDSVSSFLQRMGRSGRRGTAAYVAWILKNPCELLCSVAIIECAMDREVEDLWPPEQPWNVLLQQVFLYLHHTVQGRPGNPDQEPALPARLSRDEQTGAGPGDRPSHPGGLHNNRRGDADARDRGRSGCSAARTGKISTR